jgi:two-component system, sensor histidine kinase and response regulator
MEAKKEAKKKESILIVDDQMTNLKILSSILSKDYSLGIANSGENALKYMDNNTPDLILLDIMMPEMDGYEVCQKIKQNETYKDIPVIFLTAKTDIDDVVKGFEYGAVDYITKPFNISELKVRVRNHLNLQAARNELKKANTKLTKINKEKDRFFSIIAHDLRSPLSGFEGLSRLLVQQIRANNLDMIEKYASAMQQSSKITMELLMNLMTWSRSQTGTLDYQPEELSLQGIVNESVALLQHAADEKNITLETPIIHDANFVADKEMMGVILRNIVSNAIKFTKPGGSVMIKAEKNDSEVTISVTDDGIGMTGEMLNSLFRIDTKVRRTGTNKEPSTGLGLLLCKEFVDMHGGKMSVESEEGKGTKITVIIPAKEE